MKKLSRKTLAEEIKEILKIQPKAKVFAKDKKDKKKAKLLGKLLNWFWE